jgi:hypothetical protein
MSSLDTLAYADRAAFAVTSRLLSCMITESLLPAHFVHIDSSKAVGACIVLSKQANATTILLNKPYRPADVFAIVPLKTVPIFRSSDPHHSGQEIGLVDPLDMLPLVYEVREEPSPNPALKVLSFNSNQFNFFN